MHHILFGLLAATALAAPAFSQDAARMDKAASAEADRSGFMGLSSSPRTERSCSTRAMARPISNGRSRTTAKPGFGSVP